MANLSQQKRQRMLNFLEEIKKKNQDEKTRIAINEIENELTEKKYGLIWEKHEENVDIQMRMNVPVFTEVKDREIIGMPDSNNFNFLLEGDNLHSLKLLEKTHKNKVDLIYIDPPYNTKSQDFIYDDCLVDNNDDFKHSKWLSFMSERLNIARPLLKEDGMIMISINEVELYTLKLLCDSIFGEDNFLAKMIWQSTPGSNTGIEIKTVTEYVLVYAKNKSNCKVAGQVILDNNKYKLEDEYVERRGKYILNKLDRRMTGQHYSDALNYQIEMPDGQLLFAGSFKDKRPNWNWRWAKSKMEWGIKNGFIVFKKTNNKWAVYFKQYQFVNNNDEIIQRKLSYQNLIKDESGINSARGTKEVMDMFNSKAFDYPKPLNLLKYLLRIHPNENALVLDFFAGSGTTGHAVLSVNSEDNGNRKFILCTNNENNICEEVTYQRLYKVINGYMNKEPISSNLKYYKTYFIPKISDKEFYSVGEELTKHIKEMVQLEHSISLDSDEYILLLTEHDADELEKNKEKLSQCREIYISSSVFLTSEQKRLFSGIAITKIPDYYFEEELKEIGEL